MKIKKTQIPQNSLVCNYLPGNYSDAFVGEIISEKEISPEELLHSFWSLQPGWVKGLFKLRNTLVKPFGLETGENPAGTEKFGIICNRSGNEVVMLLEDKHLNAWLSVHIENQEQNRQKITLSTVVSFHYWLGYVYFYTILPFHHLVVKESLKFVLKIWTK